MEKDGLILIHHGIKGQKWGVRNDKESTGAKRKSLTGKINSAKSSKSTSGRKTSTSGKSRAGLKIAATILATVGTMVAADYLSAAVTGDTNLTYSGQLALAAMKLKT